MNTRWALHYRPKKFKEVLGQSHVVTFFEIILRNYYEKGISLPVGALFGGHSGVGKTTIARVISASLNCSERDGCDPCGKCSSCESIIKGTGGVYEIDASFFGLVDNIRYLRTRLASYSFQEYQVVIIDECHMLSREASNVLLKLFEEPPEKVFFILCTTEVDRMLETVRSRLVEFRFAVIDQVIVFQFLKEVLKKEEVKCDDDLLEQLIFIANNNVRDMLVSLEQLAVISGGDIKKEHLDSLYGEVFIYDKLVDSLRVGDFVGAINIYDKYVVFQSDFRHLLNGIIRVLGDRLQLSLKKGGADARWYADSLRFIYEFIHGRFFMLEGASAARLLFSLLVPKEFVKEVLAYRQPKSVEVEVAGGDIFDFLTDK